MARPKLRGRQQAEAQTLDDVREIALALPGVVEGTSYGTPAWRVRKKLLSRLHDSGDALVVRVGFDEREVLMEADPKAFFITDHYRDHAMMLVSLAHVRRDELERLLEQSYRELAPRKLVAELDARR